jgi:hypothetical protein
MNQSWFLVLFSILPCLAQAMDYFPLVPGSRWVYRSNRFGETRAISVGQPMNQYHEVLGFEPERVLVRRTAEGNFVRFNTETRQEQPFLLFDNTAFPAASENCQQQAQSTAREETYQGPVGSFDGARRVTYQGGICADAGTQYEIYVPNLGLARRVETSFAGEKVFDLVYAQIGGVTYISEAGIGFGIAANALPGERGTTQITARLVLRNGTDVPFTLTFPSGQRFDFRVRNAAGESIFTWSATRLFPAVVGTITVRGEEVWQESFAIPALSAGTYSVEGFLTNRDGKTFSATTSFEIR